MVADNVRLRLGCVGLRRQIVESVDSAAVFAWDQMAVQYRR